MATVTLGVRILRVTSKLVVSPARVTGVPTAISASTMFGVGVFSGVGVNVTVSSAVALGVLVGVSVGVAVGVTVGVTVGVVEGDVIRGV